MKSTFAPFALFALLLAPLEAANPSPTPPETVAMPADPADPADPQGNQVEKWRDATIGTRLDLGRPVWFSRKPNYTRFSPDGHDLKLTDEILSSHPQGQIWFSEETVGWSSGADTGIDLLLDLGESQPIDRVVARFLGGAQQHSLVYPRAVSILLSEDGKLFHQVIERQKINAGEKELAEMNPETYFYLPEEGTAFVEPLTLPVNARGRYVVVRITGASSWAFLDELAVLKSENPEKLSRLDGFPKEIVFREGVAPIPRTGELVITANLPTPNFLVVRDFRETAEDNTFDLLLDLPEGIRFLNTPEEVTRREKAPEGRVHYVYRGMKQRAGVSSALFLGLSAPDALAAGEHEARFSWLDGDTPRNTTSVPVKVISIPEVPPSAALLDASLTWMTSGTIRQWPDFYNTYRKLGFHIVPTFPSLELEEAKAIASEARKEGLRVVMNDSPFHRLEKRRQDKKEIRHLIDGKPGRTLCPVYAGTYYDEEIRRVGELAHEIAPDFIFYDIEIWHHSIAEGKRCTHCREAQKKAGVDRDTLMLRQGTRFMRDLHQATLGSAPEERSPVVGLYNNRPSPPVYHDIFDFREIYPRYVQQAQPSLYVQGNGQLVHNSIRAQYEALGGKRAILPWLTAGTYGRFPAYKLEEMILESYLNGAEGITYYAFRDFDPMSLYYHARALAKLASHAELLTGGKAIAAEGGDETLRCSAFGNEKEALLLTVNTDPLTAHEAAPRLAGRPIPASRLREIHLTDPASDHPLTIPAGGHRLFHVTLSDQP